MKSRSVAKIIIKNFCKTIGIILLLLGIGVASYYLTSIFLDKTERVERSTQYEHVIDVNPGSMESSNLIYSYDEDSGKIKAMVLELFDAGTKNMTYITIPANTQITISSTTYEEFIEVCPGLPQVVTMADINSYFTGDVAYEYGILILQEEFDTDIGYFTAMTTDVFDQCFEREEGNIKIYRPTDDILTEASACETEDDMKDFIESKWDTLISDITLRQKQLYADELKDVDPDLIYTHRVYGNKTGDVFKLAEDKNEELVETIWEKKAYKKAQKKNSSSDTSATTDSTIWIYNGSQITGLAAAYKEKLEEDGYTVSGVSNATGDIRTTTVIYIKKKGLAKGLKGYFNNPTIEVTDSLSSGADIEIVLGTADDID